MQLREAAPRGPGPPPVRAHQRRHARAVEMSREGIPLLVIQRQLGHPDLGITPAYLHEIDNTELIHTVQTARSHDPRHLAAPAPPLTRVVRGEPTGERRWEPERAIEASPKQSPVSAR